VIGEAGTGRRDAAGRLYAETPQGFQDLFGILRPAPNPSPDVDQETVASCGAERFPGMPAIMGTTWRNGSAFFMDSQFPQDDEACGVLQQMLDACGVKPTFRLQNNHIERGSKNRIASLVVRQRGALSYLFLTGDGNQTDSKYRIAFPHARYVYEVKTGSKLGLLNFVEGQIRYGEALLYALSPSPVTAFTATGFSTSIRPGDTVVIPWKLAVDEGTPGDRLIRIDCSGDLGVRPFVPRTQMLIDGVGQTSLFMPLNCGSGALTLTATDLTSGAVAPPVCLSVPAETAGG
jgi:hypothetical protein